MQSGRMGARRLGVALEGRSNVDVRGRYDGDLFGRQESRDGRPIGHVEVGCLKEALYRERALA